MNFDPIYESLNKNAKVTIDSRTVLPGDIFIALKGNQVAGGQYAQNALDKGASKVIVDDPHYLTPGGVLVDDCVATLQALAKGYRKRLNCKVIAIAGSNGKTTSKELIALSLGQRFRTQKTEGNLNNHLGVPLTLLNIKQETEFAVIELGANHQGENADLCQLVQPNFALVTNIGKDHLEGFGGLDGVQTAYQEVVDYININEGDFFWDSDNDTPLDKLNLPNPRIHCFQSSQLRISKNFPRLVINENGVDYPTHFFGQVYAKNIAAAMAIGEYFNVKPVETLNAISQYNPQNKRSQIIEWKNNTVILDCYNANPSSMEAILHDFINSSATNKQVILGDMLELGKYAKEEHENIVSLLENSKLAEVFLVGDHFREAVSNSDFELAVSIEDLSKSSKFQSTKNATILVKGSRRFQLEKLFL